MSKKPAAFYYRGIKVTPTYVSANGSGRTCKTLQGWNFYGPRKAVWWQPSKKQATQCIDRWYSCTETTDAALERLPGCPDNLLEFCGAQWPDDSEGVRAELARRRRRGKAAGVVAVAQKRLRRKYGRGFDLLSSALQKALLYESVVSPAFVKSTGFTWEQLHAAVKEF